MAYRRTSVVSLTEEPAETSVSSFCRNFRRRILRLYQKNMFKYGINEPHPVFFVEMRLGKTLVTIRVLKYRNRRLNLILAPFSAFDGWHEDLFLDGYQNVYRFDCSKKKRERLIDEAYEQYIEEDVPVWCLLNHDAVRAEIHEKFSPIPWQSIVADESTFLKNPDSARTKAMFNSFSHPQAVRVLLTGTPAPETELEYHQQLNWVNPSILNEPSFYRWRHYNFTRGLDPGNKQWFIKLEARRRLSQKLAKHCFFLTRDQVDLEGEIIEEVKIAKFSPAAAKLYNDMETNFLMEIDGIEYKTVWSVAQFAYLRRLAGGIVDGKVVWNGKLELLVTLLQSELKGQQVIIWAHHVDEIKAIQDRLRWLPGRTTIIHGEVSKNQRNLRRRKFQQGYYQYCVIQPGTQKFGSDYSAASTMIYYSLPPGLETFQQSRSRFIKVGKKGSLLVIYLTTTKSVDVGLLKGLREKRQRNERMQIIVKEAKERHGYR